MKKFKPHLLLYLLSLHSDPWPLTPLVSSACDIDSQITGQLERQMTTLWGSFPRQHSHIDSVKKSTSTYDIVSMLFRTDSPTSSYFFHFLQESPFLSSLQMTSSTTNVTECWLNTNTEAFNQMPIFWLLFLLDNHFPAFKDEMHGGLCNSWLGNNTIWEPWEFQVQLKVAVKYSFRSPCNDSDFLFKNISFNHKTSRNASIYYGWKYVNTSLSLSA